MRKTLLGLLIVTTLATLASCDAGGGPEVAVARSAKQRVAAPSVAASDAQALVHGNNQFALDLYRILRQDSDNLIYSPYSVSLALAMTYAGARGETEAQMADALHFTLPQERLHPAFNSLDQALTSRGAGPEDADAASEEGEGFRLHIANAVWGQEGYEFLDLFLDLLAQNYGAGVRLLDFAQAPEKARTTINEWVSRQTEGKIENLIPQGAIDAATRLVLTNAIYFNAAWMHPFETGNTQDGPFHLLDGGQVTVPMMRQTETFGYAQGQGYQAVELRYAGPETATEEPPTSTTSALILLPEEGEFEAFEDSLDAQKLNAIVESLAYEQVELSMPKFEFDADFSLVEALKAMGMTDAFTGAADFSGMTGDRALFIAEIVHKAFIGVDEEGTEAAAATAVIMAETAMPVEPEPIQVTVDRPFLFLIRDRETGSLLFVGRVVNPES